jgi:hypothetical protein
VDILNLEELKKIIYIFSPIQCDFLTENCIVGLEDYLHSSGCILKVDGDNLTDFEINWKRKVKKAGYRESKKIIEHGAEALSFLLSTELTEFTIIEEALIGTGIDYWLGFDEKHPLYDPRNFFQARLEISGIGKESPTNSIEIRIQKKKVQSSASDSYKLPAYLSIIELATPKAYFGKK